MKQMTVGTNMAVFVLFFGISVLDAFASRSWWRVAFWLAIALVFAAMAFAGQRRRGSSGARVNVP